MTDTACPLLLARSSCGMTDRPSSRLYTAVTKHWPRIAAGLVAVAVAADWVIGSLTSSPGVQFYVFAWAATTAGLWFLFDKAESAMSARSRKQVAERLVVADLSGSIASAPQQFIELFDSIFGDRHLTWRCFRRSSLASVVAVVVSAPLAFQIGQIGGPMLVGVDGFGPGVVLLVPVMVVGAILMNLVPDYLSLLETRWMMRFAVRSNWLLMALLLDFLATSVIAFGVWVLGATLIYNGVVLNLPGGGSASLGNLLGLTVIVGFQSTYFTSVWLVLYVLSVPVSRLLLRMNNGVGFLLRVTDVERQPFRSMGFVSVIIVSALFALGLPLVLL